MEIIDIFDILLIIMDNYHKETITDALLSIISALLAVMWNTSKCEIMMDYFNILIYNWLNMVDIDPIHIYLAILDHLMEYMAS